MIRINQNAKANRRRNLFRLRKIMRQVVRNLTGMYRNLPIVRILQIQVPDHRQRPLSDCASDIQMPVCLQGQHHKRLLHVALYITVMICRNNNSPQRAVAVKADRQKVIVILEHVAHHECPHHRPSKRRRRSASRSSVLPSFFLIPFIHISPGRRKLHSGGHLHRAVTKKKQRLIAIHSFNQLLPLL